MRSEKVLLDSPKASFQLRTAQLLGCAPICKIRKRLGHKHQYIKGIGARGYAATNFNAAPLMQYRNPVGLGPSLKICP